MNKNNDTGSIELRDIIDIELLQNFQDKFAESMGFASIVVDRWGEPVTKPSLFTTFCGELIHSNTLGSERCAECHRKGGEIAAASGKPYIYTCHAGLIDFATPILVNGELVGTILGGQVLTKIPDKERYADIAKKLGIDETKLTDAVESVEVITEKRLKAAADMLFLIANTLSQIGYEQCILRDMSLKLESEVISRDLMLEEAKRYNELKTQFFSTISHELKTPLNIIFSSVQLLESIYNKNEQYLQMSDFFRYSKIMKQNCYRLLKLTNNLIDINKIEAGFLSLNLNNKDIIKAVEDTVLSIADYATQKNINVVFDTELEEKITAFDVEKLERIMLNLLSNSVKFTNSGGNIYVNINDENNFITISVKDDGIGIPQNMLDKIFNTFIQVDGTFTRNAEGSGIGLSIVKSLVEMHGWEITVCSELNEGSNFTIRLPIRVVNDEVDTYQKDIRAMNRLVESIKIEFSDIYL